MTGILLASGRRTATFRFRDAGITAALRRAYHVLHAVGHRHPHPAVMAWIALKPCVAGVRRLTFAIEDLPTNRYGPRIEGVGKHRNPALGPAGVQWLHGHVWMELAALASRPQTAGTCAAVRAQGRRGEVSPRRC